MISIVTLNVIVGYELQVGTHHYLSSLYRLTN